ncbi:MAG: sensor histidine kinase [Cyanobacteria bacterium]|nr:sensor histidine kinase [Cyanobacteriota bacterium]
MVHPGLKWMRMALGFLAGVLLCLIWQCAKNTSPELESVKLRHWLFTSAPKNILWPENVMVSLEWLAYVPYLVAMTIWMTVLKPLPRFILWASSNLLCCLVGVYAYVSHGIMVPLGDPVTLLNCSYLCATLIHLETERIHRSRELALKLSMQSEEERKRIAQDLHDETLPSLSRVVRLADELRREYGESSLPQEIRSRLESTMNEMRRVVNDLHPAILENLGLAPALQHLSSKLEQDSGIKTTFECKTEQLELSSFASLCIYRIAQEALNNVEKHSGASSALVLLERTENHLRLSISDNGTGGVKPRSESHGLRNIIDRATLIGARVEWKKPESFPTGTMLVLSLPVSKGSSAIETASSIQSFDRSAGTGDEPTG